MHCGFILIQLEHMEMYDLAGHTELHRGPHAAYDQQVGKLIHMGCFFGMSI